VRLDGERDVVGRLVPTGAHVVAGDPDPRVGWGFATVEREYREPVGPEARLPRAGTSVGGADREDREARGGGEEEAEGSRRRDRSGHRAATILPLLAWTARAPISTSSCATSHARGSRRTLSRAVRSARRRHDLERV